MPEFIVKFERTVVQVGEVLVEADCLQEAERKAKVAPPTCYKDVTIWSSKISRITQIAG